MKIICKMELNEIHNCKECQGKIVAISIDKLGIQRCGYCGESVNYKDIRERKVMFENENLQRQ